jgi:hypothetical protein
LETHGYDAKSSMFELNIKNVKTKVKFNNIAFFNSNIRGGGSRGHSNDGIKNLLNGYLQYMIVFSKTRILTGGWICILGSFWDNLHSNNDKPYV